MRESEGGDSQDSVGGGSKQRRVGRRWWTTGGMGCWRRGRGVWWRPTPPSPPSNLTLPQWPSGGGDGAEDSLVGTKVDIAYPTGVEVGTVTDVHRRKAGVVWAEYPHNPRLYEAARGLLFPVPEGVQEHLDRVSKGKGKATTPPLAFGRASSED